MKCNYKDITGAGGIVIVDNKNTVRQFIVTYKEKTEDSTESIYVNLMLSTSIYAIKKALDMGCTKLNIVSDYKGLAGLASGSWLPNTEVAEEFISVINHAKKNMKISFSNSYDINTDKYGKMAEKAVRDTLQ